MLYRPPQNPEGAFTTTHGKKVAPAEAVRKLENMAENLGTLIDLTDAALAGVMESDRKRK